MCEPSTAFVAGIQGYDGAMEWPLLRGVADDEVRRILQIARDRRFARNEVVFHRSDPGDTLHLIRSGRFAVTLPSARATVMLAILGRGETFGELALVDDEDVRSATVVALEDSRTWSIHKLDFGRVKRQHPGVNDVLLAILSAQVRRLSERVSEALYVPAPRRVRRHLCSLAEIYSDGVADPVVPLTQETIAQLAGTSRAQVNDVLRRDEAAGLVSLSRGRVRILDHAGLARRAGP
jgi:CRP-like cAMP-binding protein